VISFFRYQRVQDRKIQAVRQQIADDLHDEVGSVLTGIHMFSESLKRMIHIQDREANYMLGRIGTNAQKTLSSFRDIVWAINPNYDRLEQLMYRMRQVVAETSDASNIKCSFDTAIQGQAQTKLNPKIRHNIFLIFKEALNNAVKYSKATKIDIKLEVNDRHLTLEVTDNGQGFDMDAPASGNGLSNLKKRANALNGIFKFNSTVGKGTQLFLQVSLKSRRLA
jgi:signal transduction histidine kinase